MASWIKKISNFSRFFNNTGGQVFLSMNLSLCFPIVCIRTRFRKACLAQHFAQELFPSFPGVFYNVRFCSVWQKFFWVAWTYQIILYLLPIFNVDSWNTWECYENIKMVKITAFSSHYFKVVSYIKTYDHLCMYLQFIMPRRNLQVLLFELIVLLLRDRNL